MYPLIPYKRLRIQTSLTPDDAVQVLARIVNPRPWYYLFWSRVSSKFEGRVSRNGFNINRATRYRNSFVPVLHGRFRLSTNGTVVDVRMIMHPTVLLFLLFWYVIIVIALFEFAVNVEGGVPVSVRDWIPLGILVFIYAISFLGFGLEAERGHSDAEGNLWRDLRPNKSLQVSRDCVFFINSLSSQVVASRAAT